MVSGCGLSLFGTVGGDPQDQELARSWLGLLHGGATTQVQGCEARSTNNRCCCPKEFSPFPTPILGCRDIGVC